MNIYILDLSKHTNAKILDFYKNCPQYRKEKIDRAKRPDDKLRLLGSEIVIQYVLNKESISYDELSFLSSGKPVLSSGKAFLSVTHSGSICAVAFSDADIGLDVEPIFSRNPKLISRFLSHSEQLLIDKASDKDICFTEIWTRKEALIKALPSWNSPLSELNTEKDLFYHSNIQYALSTFTFEDYIFSVCRKSNIDGIRTFTVAI